MNGISGKLLHQDWMVAPETVKIMAALCADGGDARFVGGCVRNALVNRRVHDIDIATPLPPEEIIERLRQFKIQHVPIGLRHGTVTALVDGKPFEITTLRRDVMTFGRHAEVKFTDDWKTDAARRDFTVNAIYATSEGDLFDPFGGIEDLRIGRIRFVGDPDKRVAEDYLRILRFFRIFAHFGKGEPDTAGLKACIAAAKKIATLSAERIRQEVLKILESDQCGYVWQLMLQSGISTHFLPEATAVLTLKNLVQLELLQESAGAPLRRLAAVLDVTVAGLPHIVQALKLSNEQASQLLKMTDPAQAATMSMTEQEVHKLVYRQGPDMARSLLLLAAARERKAAALSRLYHAATSFRAPQFPVTGNDAIAAGIPAGPKIGEMLHAVEDWWIAEDFRPDRQACLEKMKKL